MAGNPPDTNTNTNSRRIDLTSAVGAFTPPTSPAPIFHVARGPADDATVVVVMVHERATMTACSAWCQPEKGIHVALDYLPADSQPTAGLSVMLVDTCQGPAGTVVLLLDCEPATEAEPSGDPRYPDAWLCTWKVLGRWAQGGVR